jgi:hypothetical protein
VEIMRLTPIRAAVLAAATAITSASSLFAAAINPGNLVVTRVGDGTTTAAGTALPVRLDEYSVTYTAGAPTGVSLVQTIPLPTGAAGTAPTSGQRYLGQGGTAGGEGGLALSTNGQYMTLAGYNSGLGDLTNGTGNTEVRVVGRLELATGTVDTSTTLATSAGNAVRSAFTTDGTNMWVASSAQGTRFTTFGNNSGNGTALTGSDNERRVYVYNNQLYTSRMSAGIDGVATVGSGTPTSGTQTVTLLPGMPTATNSMYDYFFADANTLYTVDDRNTGAGAGLEKWTFNSGTGTWSMAYSYLPNPTGTATAGLKSLGGYIDASGNVVLFASTTGTSQNFLFGFYDTLSNTNVANLNANALLNAGTAFQPSGTLWSLRGVAVAPVPEPCSLTVLVLCGSLAAVRRRR